MQRKHLYKKRLYTLGWLIYKELFLGSKNDLHFLPWSWVSRGWRLNWVHINFFYWNTKIHFSIVCNWYEPSNQAKQRHVRLSFYLFADLSMYHVALVSTASPKVKVFKRIIQKAQSHVVNHITQICDDIHHVTTPRLCNTGNPTVWQLSLAGIGKEEYHRIHTRLHGEKW